MTGCAGMMSAAGRETTRSVWPHAGHNRASLRTQSCGRSLYCEKYLTIVALGLTIGFMHNIRPEWAWGFLASISGMLGAVIALHSDDLQFATLFLFVQCAIFGFARPEQPWRWACLVSVWVPLSLVLVATVSLPSPRELTGLSRLFLAPLVVFLHSPTPVTLRDIPPSFLALLPSIAGAYTGSWMSRMMAAGRPV